MEKELLNYKVKHAGFLYIGHLHSGEFELLFENISIKIPQKRIGELFEIFDINTENGVYFESLKDKYCRIYFENEKAIAIINILDNNKVFVLNEK